MRARAHSILITAAAAAVVSVVPSVTRAAQLTANWNGTTGQWTDATRWSTGSKLKTDPVPR